MSDEKKSGHEQNTAIGQRIQERFDLYLLGLIFTTLALSIQTAKFNGPAIADIAELASWLLFLIAGLAGLWRLEYVPVIYRLAGLLAQQNENAHAADMAKSQGTREFIVAGTKKTVAIEDYIQRARDDAAKIEAALEPHERRNRIKYRVMKTAFVLGLVSLIVARAAGPVQRLVHPSQTAPPATPAKLHT